MNALNSPNANILKPTPQFNLKTSFEKDLSAIKPVDLSAALNPAGALLSKTSTIAPNIPAPYARQPEIVKKEVETTLQNKQADNNRKELESRGLPATFGKEPIMQKPAVPDFSYAKQPTIDQQITDIATKLRNAGVSEEEINAALTTRVIPKLSQNQPTIAPQQMNIPRTIVAKSGLEKSDTFNQVLNNISQIV